MEIVLTEKKYIYFHNNYIYICVSHIYFWEAQLVINEEIKSKSNWLKY